MIWASDGIAFGVWKPEAPLPLTSWSFHEGDDYLCFVEGVFYEDYCGHEPLHGDDPKLADLLVQNYKSEKEFAIAALNGCFSGFLFHRQSSTLATFVDRLGVRALYWSCDQDLVVSSNLSAFKRLKVLKLDDDAAFQFLTIGFPIGERTLLRNVSIQLPCTVNTYKAGANTSGRYWKVPARATGLELKETVTSIVTAMEEFASRIQKRTRGETLALGLTGGHDSRLILSALASQQLSFQAFRWRENNFNDHVVQRLCLLTDVSLLEKSFPATDMQEIKENVFVYSDGHSMDDWGFAVLAKTCAEHEIEYLLLGFAGGPISGGLTIPEPEQFDDIVALASYELKSQMEQLSFEEAQALLIDASYDRTERAKAEWNASFDSEKACSTFSDTVIWQRTANRNRKRIRNAMVPALQYTQLILPYLDNAVLDAYFRAPIEHLTSQRAHCYAGYYRFKEFGEYPASGFPIPLKWEARLPIVLRTARGFRDCIQGLRSRVKQNQFNSGNERVKEYVNRISNCPIFDVKHFRKALSENRLARKSVFKMHTLAKFFETYVEAAK